MYSELKEEFLRKHEEMESALLNEEFVPPWLYEEYEKAKTALLVAQETI